MTKLKLKKTWQGKTPGTVIETTNPIAVKYAIANGIAEIETKEIKPIRKRGRKNANKY